MKYKEFKKESATPEQLECYDLLCRLVGGSHHIEGVIRDCSSVGISVNLTWPNFATFDNNYMTRLVFLAHDRCIRASLAPVNSGFLKLSLWKRKGIEGSISERHPNIEEAVQDFRVNNPL